MIEKTAHWGGGGAMNKAPGAGMGVTGADARSPRPTGGLAQNGGRARRQKAL